MPARPEYRAGRQGKAPSLQGRESAFHARFLAEEDHRQPAGIRHPASADECALLSAEIRSDSCSPRSYERPSRPVVFQRGAASQAQLWRKLPREALFRSPPVCRATVQLPPADWLQPANCIRQHRTSETLRSALEIAPESSGRQAGDGSRSPQARLPTERQESKSDWCRSRTHAQPAHGCAANADLAANGFAAISIRTNSRPWEIPRHPENHPQTGLFAAGNRYVAGIYPTADSGREVQTGVQIRPSQNYPSSRKGPTDRDWTKLSRAKAPERTSLPSHSPAGAAAIGAGTMEAEAETRVRESATIGSENSPAGFTNFSRKFLCHSSNISIRQMRPVRTRPPERWSFINLRMPLASKYPRCKVRGSSRIISTSLSSFRIQCTSGKENPCFGRLSASLGTPRRSASFRRMYFCVVPRSFHSGGRPVTHSTNL